MERRSANLWFDAFINQNVMTRSDEERVKIKRSRNGCNECRRLHRRCGEQKPACVTCVTDGKQCSYERKLGWINGTSKRADAKGTRIKLEERGSGTASEDDAIVPTTLPGLPGTIDWLPWLSHRHRHLVAHFANSTCSISFLDVQSHHSLCSSLLPLAFNTNWSFHLVSAMLCVALTHRRSLGMEVDHSEVAYWESMAVGHLRRQSIGRDETSENAFAATALLLCMKDIFAGGERVHSWRAHLEGAMAILNRPTTIGTLERAHLQKLGQAMQRVALSFGLPAHIKGGALGHGRMQFPPCGEFSSCTRSDDQLGFSTDLLHRLHDIQSVVVDMTALMHMETESSSQDADMELLWGSLMQRVDKLVSETSAMKNGLVTLEDEINKDQALTEEQEFAILNQAYYHITISQIQLQLLGHEVESETVQEVLSEAMRCIRMIKFRDHSSPSMGLLQPAFAVGCFALSEEMRGQILNTLDALKKHQGRENAKTAEKFLVELWHRRDQKRKIKPEDCLRQRRGLGIPHRARSYEWTDLMAEKGWDLCLW